MSDSHDTGGELAQQALQDLFEDQKFSGQLLSRMFRLHMSEEEMDAIFKRAEDEIVSFANALSESGATEGSSGALSGYVQRLKRQILKNPSHYVEGA